MRALDRKLMRDLGRLWPQALAIALVMACGAATLLLATGAYRSLEETRQAYYDRYRFGDVFASAVRVPKAIKEEILRIPGVAAAETRIAARAILDIPGMAEPASGQALSLPPSGEPAVNALYLRAGRLPDPAHLAEIVVNERFALAHGLAAGSRLDAVIDGAKVRLTIAGVVLSPEYVYALGPGDMMPDDRRFGVLWLSERLLGQLTEREGAFNSVSLRLLRGTDPAVVIEALDRLLAPYGGTGAIARKDQLSNAFLDGELTQLAGMAWVIPPIFLAVSAFLVNMILSRLILLEREQIGLLKALGYGRAAVAWHYLKLVFLIAAVGIVIGFALGTWAGWGMTRMYAQFYSFPFLIFRTDPDIYLIAGAVSAGAALVGGLRSIAAVFALPAAVAMQPAAPAVYRRILAGLFDRVRIFSQLTTMGMRHLARYPARSGLTVLGTSFAVSLMCVAIGTQDSITFMVEAIFYRTERQDVTLALGGEKGPAALAEIRHMPGVLRAEPFLVRPATLTHGRHERQLTITGKPPGADLSRVLDLDLEPVVLPPTGLAIGDRVAAILDLRPGDMVEVAFLDGARRTATVPVTQVIQSYVGLMVFMDIEALARLGGTGPRISGAHLAIDMAALGPFYEAVKATPHVAGVALETVSRQRFEETMETNVTVMLTVYLTLSGVIAFGVVYNSARIQLSERARELAILRVLGFGRREVWRVIMIELGAIVLAAQPVGWLVGIGFGYLVTSSIASDLFRVPFVIRPATFAGSSLVVVAAAVASALIVRNRIARFDLVRVLKSRE